MPCNNLRPSVRSASNCPTRVVILAKRVFDACLSQFAEPITMTVTFPSPVVNFVSAVNSGPGTLSDVSITPITGSVCSRVRYTLTIPMTVFATNAGGTTITGTGTIVITRDILLRIPADAVIQPQVNVTVRVTGYDGVIVNNTELTLTCCFSIISRIVAEVDVIVDALGYPRLEPCTEFSATLCDNQFTNPVYPVGFRSTSRSCRCRR